MADKNFPFVNFVNAKLCYHSILMFIHILCNLHDPKFALNVTVCRMFCLLVLTNEVNLTNTNYNLKTSMEDLP